MTEEAARNGPTLAEYLFCEVNAHKKLKPYFKVLDPSCGFGTFLVTVYQKLIQIVQKQRQIILYNQNSLQISLCISMEWSVRRMHAM